MSKKWHVHLKMLIAQEYGDLDPSQESTSFNMTKAKKWHAHLTMFIVQELGDFIHHKKVQLQALI